MDIHYWTPTTHGQSLDIRPGHSSRHRNIRNPSWPWTSWYLVTHYCATRQIRSILHIARIVACLCRCVVLQELTSTNTTLSKMQLFTTAAFAAALMSGVSGFSVQQLHASRAAKSQLKMSSEPSRRDILSNAASAAALGISALVIDPNTASAASLRTGNVTPQSAANKAAESYQGVYSDPNHPEGYRVIMASGKGATMTLSDGESGDETFKNIPVGVNGNELSFDFGFSKCTSLQVWICARTFNLSHMIYYEYVTNTLT